MRSNFRGILSMAITTLCFSTGLFAQGKINVAWKSFQFFANDSNRVYLKYKLPQLICSGIQTNSALKYTALPQQAGDGTISTNINYSTRNIDSAYLSKYKKLFDDAKVKYLLEGAIYIENQQFFIVVNGTNFKSKLIPFQSEKRPLSELADVIDKACENLNYQVSRIEYQLFKPANVVVLNFDINYSGSGLNLAQDDFYRQNFLSLYLQSNLKNSKDFLVMPYNFKTSNTSSAQSADTAQHTVVLSGHIKVSSNGNCIVQPIIYFTRSDSIILQSIAGNVAYKDRLLSNILNNIQTTLNATVINGDTKDIRQFIENKRHTTGDYEAAFSRACASNQFALAYYYAGQLSIDQDCDTARGTFLKGKLLYSESNFSGAIGYLNSYIKNKRNDDEANYLLALSYSKIGRSKEAIVLLKNIDPDRIAAKDVFYQVGICYFGLDSLELSLGNFKKQLTIDENAHGDIYYFMAQCYQLQKDWDLGLQCIQKLYLRDTANKVNKLYASEYFFNYATNKFDGKDYKAAFDYYQKSLELNKTEYGLDAELRAAIYLDSPDNMIMNMINDGLTSKIFSKNIIYSDVAGIYDAIRDSTNAYIPANIRRSIRYCQLQVPFCADSLSLAYTYRHLGSDFFRLHKLDSALYYYRKAMDGGVTGTNLEDTYVNYLNLAELQLTLYDADGALSSLAIIDAKYNIKKEGVLSSDLRSYLVLYYFYSMECKVMKETNYDDETVQMQKILKSNAGSYTRMLEYWSFRTFYNWIENNKQADDAKKKRLMDNLCPLLPLSGDNDLVCVNKTR